MTPDLAVSATLIVSFAVFVTAHLTLAFRLVSRAEGGWRVILTLLPPVLWLAAVWGYRAQMRWHVAVWGSSLLVYLSALLTASAAG